MFNFPIINSIDDIREAIRLHGEYRKSNTIIISANDNDGEDSFIENEFGETIRGDLSIFNYGVVFSNTFGEIPEDESGFYPSLLRECRGIIFNNKTGEVVRRPLHKFFNAGEKVETSLQNIDLTSRHVILEKLDGSMISPYYDNGVLVWGTKRGNTTVGSQAENFVKNHQQYTLLVEYLEDNGKTAVFEWCSRKQRIVIDYPVDMLVLTAIRDKINGEYMLYDDMVSLGEEFGIPVVKAYDSLASNIEDLVEHIRGLQGQEGFVIRFDNGHMVKIKADEYLTMHRAIDNIRWEKNVLKLVVTNSFDDLLPILVPEEQEAIKAYNDAVHANINALVHTVYTVVSDLYRQNNNRKEFAVFVNKNQDITDEFKSLYFRVWSGIEYDDWSKQDFYDYIINKINDRSTKQVRIDEMRHLLGGVKWDDYLIFKRG